mmetsp:Transcript_69544/g.203515  ORF Transcript_69544/g.203515 Transcript_69544/m.203515 type:complete len:102 (-) Transcript_69544:245-550(-)
MGPSRLATRRAPPELGAERSATSEELLESALSLAGIEKFDPPWTEPVADFTEGRPESLEGGTTRPWDDGLHGCSIHTEASPRFTTKNSSEPAPFEITSPFL